ncbi:long-chain fatty acid--CoA ligase [Corynebacterium phocae]|uniref:Long-chain fatty acid--CoA ligase n=1 Tax=Corynebacterium phocae TaxID=161895 RepID=A0A1L7D0Z1_9CORY|nr:long-chain-fatty-acid--CoA ligase [Corynebacterium phocae]APT91815.1 long-chain fatty acid--CoA ligase [Corynebacterium phocae]KAA8727927.1 long-chain fatty acid--CoA ligase [Corynebacterium phocae]
MGAYETKAWLNNYGTQTPHSIDYGNTTLVDIYQDNLAANADRTATYFFGRTQTYAELDAQVRAAAAGLKAFGVRPGDKVAIILPNCPQHIAAFYAVQLLGATVVEHNPLYTEHELRGLFSDHGARVAIAWDKTATTLEKLRGDTDLEVIVSVNMIDAMPRAKQFLLKLPVPMISSKREQLSVPAENSVPWNALVGVAIGGNGKDLNLPEVSADDIALILYTSGTTGAPKGAMLSHGNLASNCLAGKAWVPGLGEKPERFLGALPMFHAYGMTMINTMGIATGAEIILLPAPQLPLIMEIFKKRTPTWFPGVPTLYDKIVRKAEEDGVDIRGVAASFSGAATLPAPTVEKWEKLTGGLLVEGYGLTETSPALCGNPMSKDRRPGWVGLPFPDSEVRIANPDNLDETQPDGTPGEILARGPQIFKGYLNRPDATAEAFHDGWFRTGDMGIMNEDGFVRLVSRIKEIIITGGFNVYPQEVEDTVGEHPDVVDVAVVGRPRADGSEDVVACVILRKGAELDPEGLKNFCRERLTRYKIPRTFYHFEELEKDQLGKVRRRIVQSQLLELLAQRKVQ